MNDELKLRLEYLENVARDAEGPESLMEKVGTIESSLDSMLDVRKHEVQRIANEFSRQGVIPNGQDTAPNTGSNSASQTGGERLNPSSEEVKMMMVSSRFNDLSKLATELEAQLPLEMAEIKPPPNPQALIEKASALGREFDELTARSAELTKRLMEQLAKDNKALADSA